MAEEGGLPSVRGLEAVIQLVDVVKVYGLSVVSRVSGRRSESRQDTGRLRRCDLRIRRHTSAVDEGILLRVAETHTEALCDIGRDVERGIMQQLVGDFDHAAQFERGERFLAECHIRFLNGCTFLDPGCAAVVHGDRDRPGSRVSVDCLRESSEDVVLFQRLDQLSLKLIRYRIAAVLVDTDGQGIAHLKGAVSAHHVPECLAVLRRSGGAQDHIALSCLRVLMDRSGSRRGELCVHLHLVLEAFDLIAQCLHVGCHLLVLLHGGSLDEAVLVPVLFQKSLGLFPQGISLISEFNHFTHGSFLHFCNKKAGSLISGNPAVF